MRLAVNRSFELDPFGHHRRYLADDGRTSLSCSSLLSESPKFSLSKLALYLSRPVLWGEFLPDCPWDGITETRAGFVWPESKTCPDNLMDLFKESVEEYIGNANGVAVFLSGGIDSAAVLIHAAPLCARRGVKLIAITADLESDNGELTSELATSLIEGTGIDVEHHIVAASGHGKNHVPVWSPIGPRLDAMPELNHSMASLARKAGAQVILTGSGADELLGTARYTLTDLVKARRYRAARRYAISALAAGREETLLEGVGICANLLPKRIGASLYWSFNWPELENINPPTLLAEPYRSFAKEWTIKWLRQRMDGHTIWSGTWAKADAWDSLFPHDIHLPSTDIPEYSPFLNTRFAEYAMGLPLHRRYSEAFSTHYQCRKALVMQLIPKEMHRHLAISKTTYSAAFSRYHRGGPTSFDRCIEYGLFDSKALQDIQNDPPVLHNARSIEMWIRGAEEFGARPVGL